MSSMDLAGCRILLVEDEFLIGLEIADLLESAGANVSGPHMTLAAAQQAARNEDADVAILDIDLRGEEVFPAAQQLRERGIPFLFYTGQPERETLKTDFPDVTVCIKPCQPATLVSALSRLLEVAA